MALIKCKECGGDVSTEAGACPKCGAKPPKQTSTATIVIGGFFALVVGSYVLNSTGSQGSKSAPPAAKSAEEVKADLELNTAIAVGRVLKKSAKDPSSFKMESFVVYPGGPACYEYRAKNSFGAIVPAKAVFDGTAALTSENDGSRFIKVWNSVCTKPGGKDRAGGLNLLRVW